VTILHERAPHVRIVWCETLVQGAAAPQAICAALRRASAADVDIIVVTRGGGSFEDLFAFSDESVVRAVARARQPVLTAIGHTTDQQLCDFAADAHVETPSAAAKAIGFETRELRGRARDGLERGRRAAERGVERLRFRLTGALVRSKLAEPRSFLAERGQRLDELEASLAGAVTSAAHERSERVRDLARRLAAHDPTRRLAERAVRLGSASLRLRTAALRRIEGAGRLARDASQRLEPATRAAHDRTGRRLELAQVRLDGNSPETLLQRGYAIVTYRGTIVRDPLAVPAGDLIEARVARGTLSARVEREDLHGNERIG
jgi:exodeoxyribonuclease VII large subunit